MQFIAGLLLESDPHRRVQRHHVHNAVLEEHIHQSLSGDLVLGALIGDPQLKRVIDGLGRDELIAGEEVLKMPVAVLFDKILLIFFRELLHGRYRCVDNVVHIVVTQIDQLLVKDRRALLIS